MAKVRAMYDHAGNQVQEAKLSDAVQIVGWKELPQAGDEMVEVETEKKAHEVVRAREMKKKEEKAISDRIESDKRLQEHLLVSRN